MSRHKCNLCLDIEHPFLTVSFAAAAYGLWETHPKGGPPDPVVKAITKTIKEKCPKFTGSRAALLNVMIEGSDRRLWGKLAEMGRKLSTATGRYLDCQRRDHIAAICYCSEGLIESINGEECFKCDALIFRNPAGKFQLPPKLFE